MNISNYLNGPKKEYSMYVIHHRSIPSLIDGLKPSQRKILYTASKHAKTFTKVNALAGSVVTCLVGSTELMLSNDKSITLENYHENYFNESFDVKCIDKDGKETFGIANNIVLSKTISETIIIELCNGKSLECTLDHKIAIRNKKSIEWIEAGNLKGDEDIVFYNPLPTNDDNPITKITRKTHSNPIPVYDITVQKHHNFAVNGGIIVHNCANYHHGSTSLEEAIIGMSQDFNNNAPLLDFEGSFGSRLVTQSASPRYIFSKISKNFETYFKDDEVLEANEDPESPEPKFYLPLIPWVLVNGIKGIAVGFATNIPSHSIKDLKKLCIDVLNDKDISKKTLIPSYPKFNGVIEVHDGKFMSIGKFELNKNNLMITELPLIYDREKYINLLINLQDQGKIVSHTDLCSKKGFKFEIKLRRNHGLDDNKIIKMFKLSSNINPNLTVVDELGKIKVFDNTLQIIKHFVDYRLTIYDKRKEYLKGLWNSQLKKNKDLYVFTSCVVNGKIVLKGKSKDDIIHQAKELDIIHINECMSLRIDKFSKEEMQILKARIQELIQQLRELKKFDSKEEYLKELKCL